MEVQQLTTLNSVKLTLKPWNKKKQIEPLKRSLNERDPGLLAGTVPPKRSVE